MPLTIAIACGLLATVSSSKPAGGGHHMHEDHSGDWGPKVAAADALFAADDIGLPWRSQAGLANGMLGTAMTSTELFLAGIWCDTAFHWPSTAFTWFFTAFSLPLGPTTAGRASSPICPPPG